MKKNTVSQKVNLFFSAFLIFAYVVCTYFIETFVSTITSASTRALIELMVFVLFGLFLFYATRVGDGKPVFRFSLSSLVLIVLPGLYAVLATCIDTLPLHNLLIEATGENMVKLAAVALGYAIPFTFISGFEIATDEADEPSEKIASESKNEAAAEEKADDNTDSHAADEEADSKRDSLDESSDSTEQ